MNITEYITRCTLEDGKIITSMPIEPIVRCRDCIYSVDDEVWLNGWHEAKLCKRMYDNAEEYQIVDLNGFCAWGERKDD